MKKYSVEFSVDASVWIVVEAKDEKEAKEKAMNEIDNPSVCCNCSEKINIGDVRDIVDVMEIEVEE